MSQTNSPTKTTSHKATHKGICQACGALQKLPSGRLSTHGYTVKWGFFSGVCHGAGHLPFEQSKDLIESCIKRAQEQIEATKETQTSLRAKNDGKAWVDVRVYGGSIKQECVIIKEGHFFYAITKEGKKERLAQYSGEYPQTVEDCCRCWNERRAKSLNVQLSQLSDYIKWQENRISNWVETPLKPL